MVLSDWHFVALCQGGEGGKQGGMKKKTAIETGAGSLKILHMGPTEPLEVCG